MKTYTKLLLLFVTSYLFACNSKQAKQLPISFQLPELWWHSDSYNTYYVFDLPNYSTHKEAFGLQGDVYAVFEDRLMPFIVFNEYGNITKVVAEKYEGSKTFNVRYFRYDSTRIVTGVQAATSTAFEETLFKTKYNSTGQLEEIGNHWWITRFTYNNLGRVSSSMKYNIEVLQDTSRINYTVFDNNGRIVACERTGFNNMSRDAFLIPYECGPCTTIYRYEYDKVGYCTSINKSLYPLYKATYRQAPDSISSVCKFTYNENGDVAKISYTHIIYPQNDTLTFESRFRYEYDKKGNWTLRAESNEYFERLYLQAQSNKNISLNNIVRTDTIVERITERHIVYYSDPEYNQTKESVYPDDSFSKVNVSPAQSVKHNFNGKWVYTFESDDDDAFEDHRIEFTIDSPKDIQGCRSFGTYNRETVAAGMCNIFTDIVSLSENKITVTSFECRYGSPDDKTELMMEYLPKEDKIKIEIYKGHFVVLSRDSR